jgi:predicted nucleotide-binding protein
MARNRPPSRRPAEPQGEPDLLVPRAQFEESLSDRIARGEELNARDIRSEDELKAAKQAYYSWDEFNDTLLRRSFSTSKVADRYRATVGILVLGGGTDPLPVRISEFHDDLDRKLRLLASLKDQLTLYADGPSTAASSASSGQPRGSGVFVVHGHHEALKQQVARTVERLTGAAPIILHEQPDGGRTIIEKFESYAGDVGFAVVLLTADDRGGSAASDELQPRARQNVVFELGYFIGRLGRGRVTVLYETGVELPSDMSGVLYTPADEAATWQLKLAREMKAANVPVDLNKLA